MKQEKKKKRIVFDKLSIREVQKIKAGDTREPTGTNCLLTEGPGCDAVGPCSSC